MSLKSKIFIRYWVVSIAVYAATLYVMGSSLIAFLATSATTLIMFTSGDV